MSFISVVLCFIYFKRFCDSRRLTTYNLPLIFSIKSWKIHLIIHAVIQYNDNKLNIQYFVKKF